MQHPGHRLGGAGRGLGGDDGGVVGVAEQGGTLGAQAGDLDDQGAGVVLAAQPAAHGPGQQRDARGVRLGGRQLGGGGEAGDARGVHGVGRQGCEAGRQGRQPGVDLAQPVGVGAGQGDAVALEGLDGQADEARGLLVDGRAVGVDRLGAGPVRGADDVVEGPEAPVQAGVEVVGVVVRRQLGGEGLLQRIEVGAVRGRGERHQHGADSVEQLPGALEGLDGVGDRGLGLVGCHGLPLGALGGHARAHGRLDVLVTHGGEVRQAEVERPGAGEGAGGGQRVRRGARGLSHEPIVP